MHNMWELFCAKAEYYGQTDERCAIIMKEKFWEGKAMDTSEMKAVLDADFENLLRKLQVYDEVVNGVAVCEFCKTPVTLSNISMVFPKDGRVCFCCDKKECTDELLKQRRICE